MLWRTTATSDNARRNRLIPSLAPSLCSGIEGLENGQKFGDDVPLIQVHMVEDDGGIRRVEWQQAHDRRLQAERLSSCSLTAPSATSALRCSRPMLEAKPLSTS